MIHEHPIVLACDTSTTSASIALLEGSALVAEWTLTPLETRSIRLLGDIEDVLKRRGLAVTDVDRFVCTLGPGSFTGVRVGMATLKGLAFATGREMVGVCSLDVLARPLLGRGEAVLAAFDARRKQVYAALYAPDGAVLVPPAVADSVQFAVRVAAEWPTGGIRGAGDGVTACREPLAGVLGDRLRFAEPQEMCVRAGVLAAMGSGPDVAPVPVADIEPLYLKRSEAEEKHVGKLEGQIVKTSL